MPGRITAFINADTTKYRRGVRSAGRDTRKFGKDVGGLGGVLGNLNIKTLAATVGFGALAFKSISLIKSQFGLLDALAKTADKLGVNVVALQRLRFAASQSGIRIQTFDMGLQRFRRRLGEAAIGTGEAKQALKELGIDARTLSTQPLENQLKAVANSLSKVDDRSQRLRFAFKLFDSEGVSLLQLLNQGEKGIEELTKEADRLGIVFRRIDLAKIEESNNALDRLQKITSAIAGEIAVNLSGALTAIVNKFNDMGGAAAGSRGIVNIFFNELTVGAFAVADAFDQMTIAFKKFTLARLKGNAAFGDPSLLSRALAGLTSPRELLFRPGIALTLFLEKLGLGIPGSAAGAVDDILGPDQSRNKTRNRIKALEAEIKALEDSFGTSATSSQQKLFDLLQELQNERTKEINKLLAGPKTGGGDAFELQKIKSVLSGDIKGPQLAGTGLRTAAELGLVNGQPRFGFSQGIQSLERKVLNKLDTIAKELKAIRQARSVGPLGITIR